MENASRIRPHITKEQRVPKCFKEVEKILNSVKSCQTNYKTILANSRLRGYNHKKVYSMTVNVLKNYNYIKKIIDKTQLLEKEKYLRREMASILIYELIFGHGFLPGESKVVKTVQLYENDIFHAHEVLQNSLEHNLTIEINVPRYVRVHTLVTTVPYVIKDLTSYGFHQVLYDNDLTEEKYLELVKNLNKGSFLIDFHFKDVLVFERHENLVSLDLYKNGHIFLQDKASCIPVHVLNPKPGCAVLDACAAPGMKTVHIAAKMKNKGILIACERDKSRFEFLKEMLDCGSVKICKTLCKDFKLIDPSDQAYSDVEYILLDPSCSGSGMVNRMDEVTDTESSKNTERLSKLAGFQIILLKHSLKFPSVKRVVYSTCSIHEEENEYVVHEALKSFNGTFKLMPAMPEWSHRGSRDFEFGELCLRTDPKVHLTNGFFVAVFERIDCDDYNGDSFSNDRPNYQVHEHSNFKKQKKKFSNAAEGCVKVEAEAVDPYNMAEPENYYVTNLKSEDNISYSSELPQMDNNEQIASVNENEKMLESSIPNVKREPQQNLVYTQQKNKKHKKRKKENINESAYETNELNLEMPNDYGLKCSKDIYNANDHIRKDKQLEQNNHENESTHENIAVVEEIADVSKLHGKTKKKKKEHFEAEMLQHVEKCHPESPENNNNMNSQARKDKFKLDERKNESTCENIAVMEEMTDVSKSHKKRKKKKKEHFEASEFQEQSNNSFRETNIATSPMRKDKSKQNELLNEKFNESIAVADEMTDVTKSHKKRKKKKKEHLEVKLLQSDKINHEQQTYKTFLPEVEGVSAENKHLKNVNYSEELFVNKTSSHKKKKKHSNVDHSYENLNESNISHSYTVSDSLIRQRVENISESNEIQEMTEVSTKSHKKKRKKEKMEV